MNNNDDLPSGAASVEPSAEPRQSRRSFLKASGLLAASGAAGAAALSQSAAAATAKESAGQLHLPEQFAIAATTPPDVPKLPMNGATLFAKACKAEGLAALFCCPGNYTVTHAMAAIGIPVYTGRDERSMSHAADAFTRVTGEVSATSGTEGPGFTNLISGLANARAARTPVLFLSSNKSVREEDTEAAIQLIEQQSVAASMVKWQKRLVNPHRNHEYAGYAFRQLKTGVPSPVHLDFTAEAGDGKLSKPGDIVYNFDKSLYRTDAKPNPSPAHIAKAIALLQSAKRPIIVSSTGVFYSKAWDALRQFAEKTQIPVVESGAMRGQFPDDHPLSATCAPNALRSEEHTSELQSHRDLHSFPTRRSSDLPVRREDANSRRRIGRHARPVSGRPSAVGHLRAERAGQCRRGHADRPVLHAQHRRVRLRAGRALHPHRPGGRGHRPQHPDRGRHRQR